MKLFLLLLTVITFYSQQLTAQHKEVNFEERNLYAKGTLPNVFSATIAEKLETSIEEFNLVDSTQDYDEKIKFLLTSNYLDSDLFWSGNVLYGDALTNYIQKVGDKVVQGRKDLTKKIEFYVYRSSQINAFCTGLGNIFVSTGLLANIETEAELAFVLSHEVAHYELKHSLSSYFENDKLLKGKGEYKKQKIEQKIALLYKFAKEDEYEADSVGTAEFLKLGYRGEHVPNVLEMLYYAYLPFDEKYIDEEFLNIGDIQIPAEYLLKNADSIPAMIERNDSYYTHPNILKRLNRVEAIQLEYEQSNTVDFFFSEETFYAVRKKARYELVRQYLIEARYSKALYSSLTLLEDDPNNRFLELSISKALYGLCKYKNANELHYVAEAYTRIQGESQKIHYLIKHLTKKQFNVVVVSFLEKMALKYPEETILEQYIEDLIRELVVVNKITTKDLKKESTTADNFHLYALRDLYEKNGYEAKFNDYHKELEELQEKENKSYKEKEKEKRLKQIDQQKNGYQIKAETMVVMEPKVYLFDKEGIMLSAIEKLQLEYVEEIKKMSEVHHIKVEHLDRLNVRDTKRYNYLLILNDLLRSYNQNMDYKLVTIMDGNRNYLQDVYDTRYVYQTYIYYNKKTKSNHFISSLIDIELGKTVYSNIAFFKGYPHLNLIRRFIDDDFRKIKT
ncbi:MAG: M48 family metallopeptidase [Flavobacteriales bacterium]|jgi:Zn-dependent protease with chaperone function|nr:M48 family metallopeptidase [Flavobacteriales bacterium]